MSEDHETDIDRQFKLSIVGPGGCRYIPEGRDHHFLVLHPGKHRPELYIAGPLGLEALLQERADSGPKCIESATPPRRILAELDAIKTVLIKNGVLTTEDIEAAISK